MTIVIARPELAAPDGYTFNVEDPTKHQVREFNLID